MCKSGLRRMCCICRVGAFAPYLGTKAGVDPFCRSVHKIPRTSCEKGPPGRWCFHTYQTLLSLHTDHTAPAAKCSPRCATLAGAQLSRRTRKPGMWRRRRVPRHIYPISHTPYPPPKTAICDRRESETETRELRADRVRDRTRTAHTPHTD